MVSGGDGQRRYGLRWSSDRDGRSVGAADLFEDLKEREGGAVASLDIGYLCKVGQNSPRTSWAQTWLPRRATSAERECKNGQHLPAVHAVKSQSDSPSTSGVSSLLPSLMARRPRYGSNELPADPQAHRAKLRVGHRHRSQLARSLQRQKSPYLWNEAFRTQKMPCKTCRSREFATRPPSMQTSVEHSRRLTRCLSLRGRAIRP